METPFNQVNKASLAFMLACIVSLGGCAVMPGKSNLSLPSDVDYYRICHLERSGAMKVYVMMSGVGEGDDSTHPLPHALRGKVGTTSQVNRRFVDMISSSRRFEVFDVDTNRQIASEGVLITGQITRATVREGALPNVPKSIIEVALSVHLHESTDVRDATTKTGRLLESISVLAPYGESPAEATRIDLRRLDDPTNVANLEAAYSAAFDKALRMAASSMEARMRPVARVDQVKSDQVALVGGAQHGLRKGDRMILFRSDETPECYAGRASVKQVVGEVTCDSVAQQSSQCQITARVKKLAIQPGDYGVLSDVSLVLRYQ